MTEPLTAVLVHGAFADASGWNGVVERLLAADMEVAAPANPLRGIAHDSAYIASFLEQIPGPVLAVGHSYGGTVIPTPPPARTTSSASSSSLPSRHRKASDSARSPPPPRTAS